MQSKWIVIATVLFLSSCSLLEKQFRMPQISLDKVKIGSMSLVDTRLDFKINISNPNLFGLSMSSLKYQLSFDDAQVLDGQTQQKTKIPAQGKGNLVLPLTVNYHRFIDSIQALKHKRKVNYRISGKADFGLVKVPFSKTGTFALPALPSISVSGIKVIGMTFKDVNIQLQLKLKNSNNFPLSFDGANYQLKIANQALLTGSTAKNLSVAPAGQSKINVNMKVSLRSLGNLVNTFRKGGTLPIKFSGSLGMPKGQGKKDLPVSWKGKVPLWR